MTGRERCEFLRNIRKNIAEMNGLDYEPHECTHEGWCPGYCPACDAESADLMRQLERKEAAGASIRIDVESIKALENMTKETDDIDDEEDNYPKKTYMGESVSPFSSENCEITPAPDEVFITAGLPEPPELIEVDEEQEEYLKEQGIVGNNSYFVRHLCAGCIRFNTIQGKDGKAVRCAALSEHFFERALNRGTCHIKKESEDDISDLDIYKSERNCGEGGG